MAKEKVYARTFLQALILWGVFFGLLGIFTLFALKEVKRSVNDISQNPLLQVKETSQSVMNQTQGMVTNLTQSVREQTKELLDDDLLVVKLRAFSQQDAKFFYKTAIEYEKRGDLERAMKYLKRAVLLDENNETYQQYLRSLEHKMSPGKTAGADKAKPQKK